MSTIHSTSLRVGEEPGGILTLELDRPSRKNALDRELVVALGSALATLPERLDVRVVVLFGAGESFCSGADLSTISDVETSELEERIDEFHLLIRAIVDAPQPVIAAVEGPAVGFGADLALSCDLRIFSGSAFLEEAFVKIGLMPDGGGSYWMDKYLGARAFEVLARGTRLEAGYCHELGLANQLVPPGQARDRALEWAQELSRTAPLALRAIKHAVRARDRMALDQVLATEKKGQARLLQSADFQEGVLAFLEKRQPGFKGM